MTRGPGGQDLIRHARDMKADQKVIQSLDEMSGQSFGSMADVIERPGRVA